jgi:hypothetical protein
VPTIKGDTPATVKGVYKPRSEDQQLGRSLGADGSNSLGVGPLH